MINAITGSTAQYTAIRKSRLLSDVPGGGEDSGLETMGWQDMVSATSRLTALPALDMPAWQYPTNSACGPSTSPLSDISPSSFLLSDVAWSGLLDPGADFATSGAFPTVEAEPAFIGSEDAPTVSKNSTQAGAYITRDNYRWNSGSMGSAVAISYSFRTAAPGYTVSGRDVVGTFSPFTASERTAAQAAFALWSDVANINFVQAPDGANADIVLGNYSSSGDASQAFAFYPGTPGAYSNAGDVFMNTYYVSTNNVTRGTYDYLALMHEIGHAIGLEHPGSYNAAPGASITYANNAEYIQDTRQYTIMSYFGESNTGGYFPVYSDTPMIHDIAAVQRLYGARTTTRTGNTVYGFNSNAGSTYLISSPSQQVAFAIYDNNGTDTLDFSGYSTNQVIDLRPDSFSSVGTGIYNVSIGANVAIEQAIGGSGNDTIYLNPSLFSAVTGGAGSDTFSTTASGWAGSTITDLGLGDKINVTDVAPTTRYNWAGTSLNIGGATLKLQNNPVGHLVQSPAGGGENLTLARQNLDLSDFNRDGRSDILWRSTYGSLAMWEMDGRTLLQGGLIGDDNSWSVVSTGDFNGDHNFDILQRNANTGQVLMWQMNGRSVIDAGLIGGDANWSVASTGDFNGDGKADILWRNVNGSLTMWLMDGRNVLQSSTIGGDVNWTVAGVGDFNGDGKTDILQRDSRSGQVLAWMMDGNSVIDAGLIGGDANWSVAESADFDGNGTDDILWRNTDGTLVEWQMSGRTITNSGIMGGDASWDVVGTGDFNNDGKSDILQRNVNTGQVLEWDVNGLSVIGAGLIGGDPNWNIVSV